MGARNVVWGYTLKRYSFLATVFTTVLVVALPFVGGGGPSLSNAFASGGASAVAVSAAGAPASLASIVNNAATAPAAIAAAAVQSRVALENGVPVAQKLAITSVTTDAEHIAQKPVPKPLPPVSASGRASGTNERRAALEARGASCPGNVGGGTGGAPGITSAGGVSGTTSDDIASFAAKFNAIRVANCLHPIPMSNFRYDSCMEQRLFWMAEDPSEDPASAWGHIGSQRSDGVPSVGCDGNLAGGSGNTGATVASKWWESSGHRASLYRPSHTGGTGGVCILFAMTHGGVPNEPYSFTRAAARWSGC